MFFYKSWWQMMSPHSVITQKHSLILSAELFMSPCLMTFCCKGWSFTPSRPCWILISSCSIFIQYNVIRKIKTKQTSRPSVSPYKTWIKILCFKRPTRRYYIVTYGCILLIHSLIYWKIHGSLVHARYWVRP